MAWRVLVFILLLQFFPIPKMPGLHVAPENFVFALALLLCWSALFRLGLRSGRISAIVTSLVAFGVLDWMHGFFQEDVGGNPAEHFRAAICILLVANVASEEEGRLRVMKWLVAIGAVQVVFGSLVYLFGEPFSTVRDWMLQSAAEEGQAIIGERSQIAALYGPPHIFAYLLAAFPLLGIGLYLLTRRAIWLAAVSILLVGLFFNAERAAAGFMLCGMLLFLWKSGQRTRVFWMLGGFVCVLVMLQHIVSTRMPETLSESSGPTAFNTGTLSERIGTSTLEEATERFLYQAHGLVSVLKYPLLGPNAEQYAREVLGNRNVLMSESTVAKVLSPHNHYVNIGLRGGVPGWALMLVVLLAIVGIYRDTGRAVRGNGRLRMQYLCISLGLAASMGNAIFHNAGIFSPELATSVMLGLLMGLYLDVCPSRNRSSVAGRGPYRQAQVMKGHRMPQIRSLVTVEPDPTSKRRGRRQSRRGIDRLSGLARHVRNDDGELMLDADMADISSRWRASPTEPGQIGAPDSVDWGRA